MKEIKVLTNFKLKLSKKQLKIHNTNKVYKMKEIYKLKIKIIRFTFWKNS